MYIYGNKQQRREELKVKKVIINNSVAEINLAEVSEITPIFVKNDGEMIGMVVKDEGGWIVRLGGDLGAYGHRDSREILIKEGEEKFHYTFHAE